MPTETPPRFSTPQGTADPDGMNESVKSAMESLQEVRAYFGQYVAAKIDGAKASARLLVLYAVLSVFGIIVGLTATVTATVLLVMGIAGGVARLFEPDNAWLANLLIGVVFIAGVAAAMTLLYPLMMRRLRRATVRKYEAMARRQQIDFGHSAAQRAAQPEHANGR